MSKNASIPETSQQPSASHQEEGFYTPRLTSRHSISYVDESNTMTSSPLGPALMRRGTSHSVLSETSRPTTPVAKLIDIVEPDLSTPLAYVLPDLNQLDQVDAFVAQESSNIVQILPEIAAQLQEFCISDPRACPTVWSCLKGLLEELHAKRREHLESKDTLNLIQIPECPAKPYVFTNCHGEEWSDDYAWLSDRSNPDVLEYIEVENTYAENMLESTKPLQKLLYREFVSRLNDKEESARVTLSDGWTYYSKFVCLF